ncbi:hypothetical protein [Rhodococcus sp. HNM0569]|uniref:hypothetical protein n=1 Tax=Rhodococcus sp. HNM0569 TaxID=2716340 RepID=UPI00146B81A7|nr:hypothetical protein [Rhodococcus sp. HNM0569]NLU84202.1 hypothetical protein [Rhodococcus sp. HNM0569]
MLAGAVVLLVVAVVAAGWFGFTWVRAVVGDGDVASARDSALDGAQQAAINLNTVDAANIDASFENMRSSITGDQMNKDLDTTVQQLTDAVRQSGATSKGEVLSGALTELNTDDKTGKALVVLAVTTTWPQQYERTKVTMTLGMRDVDGVWKAESVQPVGSRIQLDAGPTPGAEQAPAEGAPPADAPPAEAPAEEAPAEPAAPAEGP